MADIRIRGVGFDGEENVALSATFLKKSSDSTLRAALAIQTTAGGNDESAPRRLWQAGS